jgi:hypothetical protein
MKNNGGEINVDEREIHRKYYKQIFETLETSLMPSTWELSS